MLKGFLYCKWQVRLPLQRLELVCQYSSYVRAVSSSEDQLLHTNTTQQISEHQVCTDTTLTQPLTTDQREGGSISFILSSACTLQLTVCQQLGYKIVCPCLWQFSTQQCVCVLQVGGWSFCAVLPFKKVIMKSVLLPQMKTFQTITRPSVSSWNSAH